VKKMTNITRITATSSDIDTGLLSEALVSPREILGYR